MPRWFPPNPSYIYIYSEQVFSLTRGQGASERENLNPIYTAEKKRLRKDEYRQG